MEFGIAGIAAITIVSFLCGKIWTTATAEALHKWTPVLCGVVGWVIGIVAFIINMPNFPANDIINAMAIGIVSGLAATGVHQIGHQLSDKK